LRLENASCFCGLRLQQPNQEMLIRKEDDESVDFELVWRLWPVGHR